MVYVEATKSVFGPSGTILVEIINKYIAPCITLRRVSKILSSCLSVRFAHGASNSAPTGIILMEFDI
jgi:hypothetical protein